MFHQTKNVHHDQTKYFQHDYLFKIQIVGDHLSGKSALLLRFVDNIFTESFISGVGLDFKTRTIGIDKGNIALQIWEAHESKINTAYYRIDEHGGSEQHRGTHAYLILCDLSDPTSLEKIKSFYLPAVKSYDSPIILVGTKCDLLSRVALYQAYKNLKTFARKNGLGFAMTSAKENINVEMLFEEMARKLVDYKNNNKNQDILSNLSLDFHLLEDSLEILTYLVAIAKEYSLPYEIYIILVQYYAKLTHDDTMLIPNEALTLDDKLINPAPTLANDFTFLKISHPFEFFDSGKNGIFAFAKAIERDFFSQNSLSIYSDCLNHPVADYFKMLTKLNLYDQLNENYNFENNKEEKAIILKKKTNILKQAASLFEKLKDKTNYSNHRYFQPLYIYTQGLIRRNPQYLFHLLNDEERIDLNSPAKSLESSKLAFTFFKEAYDSGYLFAATKLGIICCELAKSEGNLNYYVMAEEYLLVNNGKNAYSSNAYNRYRCEIGAAKEFLLGNFQKVDGDLLKDIKTLIKNTEPYRNFLSHHKKKKNGKKFSMRESFFNLFEKCNNLFDLAILLSSAYREASLSNNLNLLTDQQFDFLNKTNKMYKGICKKTFFVSLSAGYLKAIEDEFNFYNEKNLPSKIFALLFNTSAIESKVVTENKIKF